jgi:hypothetical protein
MPCGPVNASLSLYTGCRKPVDVSVPGSEREVDEEGEIFVKSVELLREVGGTGHALLSCHQCR